MQRKRNLLILMAQYLKDSGLVRTHTTLCDEANLNENCEICDNVDLDTIYLDYFSYYQLKFGKQPKIVKKIDSKNIVIQQTSSSSATNSKSMKAKRRTSENETKEINSANDAMLLNSFITVSSLSNSNNSNSSLQSTNNDYGNSASNDFPPVEYKHPFRDYEHYNSDMKEMADIISR